MTNGAAGHTYGANGIWQVNREGQPYGPSPQHKPGSTGYGIIPWNKAMNLPGSAQVALGKKLFEQFPWQTFKPHPGWATYASPFPNSYGPFTTGSDKVRLTYTPDLHPIRITALDKSATYRAKLFNPISGATTDLGQIPATARPDWTVQPPAQTDAQDWVLIIDRQ